METPGPRNGRKNDSGEKVRVASVVDPEWPTLRLNAIQHLIDVVAQLRDPTTSCPWDLEQTHASLVPYVLQEAHEVADAIRHGDDNHLREKLGDLLMQSVLPA